MLSGLNIRQATAEDATLVQQITRDAFQRYIKKSGITERIDALSESLDDIKNDINGCHVYIAFINHVPAGSFRLCFEENNTARITRFGVTTEFRRIGVGHELLQHAEEVIKENGIKQAYLFTALSNLRLLHFYKRHGFYLEAVEGTGGYPRAKLVKKMK